ncbi:MAG: roadblock/LC7 domain-containing protein [Longimicrobiales bacterium]
MRSTGRNLVSLDTGEVERLQQLLGAYLADTRAKYVLLADRAGQLLAHAGEAGSIDRLSFASLVAADFAANDQLAHLLGEDECASLYHSGDNRGMFLVDVAGQVILAALFDGRTTLGLLRLKSRGVVPELATLFARVAARPQQAGSGLESGWLAEAESEIDRLFRT